MEKEKRKKTSWLKYVLIVLVVLQVAGLGVTFWVVKGQSDGGGGSNIASYVPIWVAVMIPIIVAKRKKKPQTDEEKKMKLWLMVGLATTLLVGMVAFLVVAMR